MSILLTEKSAGNIKKVFIALKSTHWCLKKFSNV